MTRWRNRRPAPWAPRHAGPECSRAIRLAGIAWRLDALGEVVKATLQSTRTMLLDTVDETTERAS